jgi:hypothetical protein
VACRDRGITAEQHVADWKGLGNIAGPACNRVMVKSEADLCIALHRSITTSKRTKVCIRQALAAGIPTFLIEDERAIPRRIEAGDERLASSRNHIRHAGKNWARKRDRPETLR